MANTIGIDFGTTKTMVSFFNPATGRAELVRLGRDRDSIPTTIHQDESGEIVFGEDADDQMVEDPEGYCRAFKLHLGENDPVLPRMGATAEALTKGFLLHIKEECEQNVFHGKRVDTATITVPVSFSPSRKAALKRAAEAAGFSTISFLPEPEAAGTAFLRDNPSDVFSRALVFDWGGGTLDIAIISRDEDGTIHADRHCAEGRDDVGGEEMDRMLLLAGDEYWQQNFGASLVEAEENEPKLLREAEKLKIGLSRKDIVTFRRGTRKLDVSRDQFRQIIGEMLDSAIELVKSALAKNREKGNPDPDAILLIGGTCQIPVVRETMEKNFPNLRVLSWHHSHEAVALGATEGVTEPQTHEKSQSGKNESEEEERNLIDEVLVRADKLSDKDDLEKLSKDDATIIAKAAEEGNVRAAGLLGQIYSSGCNGYPKNNELALHWADIAAKAGDNVSQAVLAIWSLGGEDSPAKKNRSNALKWAEMAYSGNKSIENTVILMLVLNSFDTPDATRIKRLGREIMGILGNKKPKQFSKNYRIRFGLAFSILADVAYGEGKGNEALQLVEKGAAFGNQECIDYLASISSEEDNGPDTEGNNDEPIKPAPAPRRKQQEPTVPPLDLDIRDGLFGGYVLKFRNQCNTQLQFYLQSSCFGAEDIKESFTLEAYDEMEIGWGQLDAARNFRKWESGKISIKGYKCKIIFSITSAGDLRITHDE